MYHVTLSSLAARVLREGLDNKLFPGTTKAVRGQTNGNFFWETLAQAETWRDRMQTEHGGRYEILFVDTEGLELVRDPAIGHGSWFTTQPLAAARIRLVED